MLIRFFHILLVLPVIAKEEQVHETTSCLIQRQARPQIASMSNDILQDADNTRSLEQLLEQERQEIASLAARVEVQDNSTEHVQAEKQPWSLLPKLESVHKPSLESDSEQVADSSPKGDLLRSASEVKESSNFQQMLREEAAKLRAKSLELQRLTDEAAKEDAEAKAELERRKEERHLARLQRQKEKEEEERRILAEVSTPLSLAAAEVAKPAPADVSVLSTQDTIAQTLELLKEEERTLKAKRHELQHRLPTPMTPTISPSDNSEEAISYSSMIKNHLKNLAAVVHRSIKRLAGSAEDKEDQSSTTLDVTKEADPVQGDASIPMGLAQVTEKSSEEVATLNRLLTSEEHLANETASLKEEIRNLTLQEQSLLEKQRISTQEVSMQERARLLSEELLNQQKLLEREQALESKEKEELLNQQKLLEREQALKSKEREELLQKQELQKNQEELQKQELEEKKVALQQIEEKLALKEKQLALQRREHELQSKADELKQFQEEDKQAEPSPYVPPTQVSLLQNIQSWMQKKQAAPSPEQEGARELFARNELLLDKIQGLLDETHKHKEKKASNPPVQPILLQAAPAVQYPQPVMYQQPMQYQQPLQYFQQPMYQQVPQPIYQAFQR
jgi:hypothetical protein